MKSIVHLSDLHFGTEDNKVLEGLLSDLDGVSSPRSSLVVISGDLTQRARAKQFHAARHFLDKLLVPYIVVAGNHDIPLYDLFRRFFKPFDLYKQYITDDLTPVYMQDDLAVMGITTAHGFTTKHGRVTKEMANKVCSTLSPSSAPWKILVAHHPFVIPHAVDEPAVKGADFALPQFEKCGVDVILTGHLHVSHASDAAGFRSDDHKIICVAAGTAISTRLRGESNSYNRLVIDGETLTVYNRVWNGERFADGPSKTYRRVQRANGEVVMDKLAQNGVPPTGQGAEPPPMTPPVTRI
ncbi:MAG: metallophosphoesterase [Myxococcota bacterium]|nr:metallophosphoesterase [Myxococcota bacterium]